ncbi:MAG TPA: error-prone DNA polymerase [Pseudolabrys sp.]|nr:error-prone DNA polymerase [Pseudolabrys sp.]
MRYVEFAVTSNFSFLRGASHPEEMLRQAAHLDMAGMGLCDRNSVAGVVRAHLLKRETKLALCYHPGARLVFADGTPDILAYPRDRAAWGRLCRLLTTGNLRAEKGYCTLFIEDLLAHIDGLELIVMEKSTNDFLSSAVSLLSTPPACPSLPPPLAGEVGSRSDPGRGPFANVNFISLFRASSASAERVSASTLTLPRKRGREKEEQRGREHAFSIEKLKLLLPLLHDAAPGRVRLAASMLYRGDDRARLAKLAECARVSRVPLIAVNDVLYHVPARRKLQDVVTCIREHMTIEAAGRKLGVNAERHLKPSEEMARLFRDAPDAIAETMRLSRKLTFSLDELAFEYPEETREGFATPQDALVHYTYEGAKARYPGGIPDKVRKSLEHELALINQLQYAPYFLTVHDIVRFARSQNILCQGRGSAANSAVCYCLGVTEVNPEHSDLLFERFVSASRREPPDIDVDFEHERREEVIQYIYKRYGRDRAGLAATVISYRGRSAMREVGKAFGLSEDAINAIGSTMWGSSSDFKEADLGRAGLSRKTARVRKMFEMVEEIAGFPRHLSQHVGGFVMTRGRLDEVVPIGNAAMEDRTCVEWDKDDLDALRILKVDVLALGMLTCLRIAFGLLDKHYPDALPAPQSALTLSAIPAEDPAVYRMLQRADSLGVFQVESRAQMSMLPRLRPEKFYDLVVEVAIVRPGPIQGDMVHPYLRRKQGIEPTTYPSKELEAVLHKTLGVPLFQEQAMQIAIVAAGFTPEEADQLRRAMATFRRVGTIGTFQKKMIEGMVAKNYAREFAERCFHQIEGFGEYGFPESHAASFALLVYASSWFKCHYPDVFAAALLNAQPMGFYAPAQIVRDVREHGVEVRHVDINRSDWDTRLESGPRAAERLHLLHATMKDDVHSTHAMRLGFREIQGIREEEAKLIVERRRTSLPLVTQRFAPLPPRFPSSPPPLAGEVARRSPKGEGVAGGGSSISAAQVPTPSLTLPRKRGREKEEQGGREQSVRAENGQIKSSHEIPYDSIRDVWLRTGLSLRALERLADADVFASLGLSRREALWAVKILDRAGDHDDLPLFLGGGARAREPDVHLPPMPPGEEVVNDYRFLKLSLRAHPAEFLRSDLVQRGIAKNESLRTLKTGAYVRVSGLVTCRQRPGSASGVIFMTIEDETSIANVIVWPKVLERFRPVVLGTRYVSVTGRMQEECGVIHVVADRLEDLSFLLGRLSEASDPAQDLDVPARATRHALSRKLAS